MAEGHGHGVRPIAPIYVKSFVKRQKSDAADAAAITEAALRLNMPYVAVNSAEHQACAARTACLPAASQSHTRKPDTRPMKRRAES